MKQTSIEWLEMEIVKLESKFAIPHAIYELCEQAKERYNKEIDDAKLDGYGNGYAEGTYDADYK